ncbi:hypothetical protein [Sinomonas sp. P10A9]|uniref:Uncharacterized protein n=1 Tax=Sinomonas puerhi TaxID=3238584 RepID=A0AB39L9W7_9MICC
MSARPQIGGTMRIRLRPGRRDVWGHRDGHALTRAIESAEHASAGRRVVFEVPRGLQPDWEGLAYLAAHARHVGGIDFDTPDPDTFHAWEAATGAAFDADDIRRSRGTRGEYDGWRRLR